MDAAWADDIFKCNIVNEYALTSINISLNFVPLLISNIPTGGSDNGLAPIRRQAIIWTNDGLV